MALLQAGDMVTLTVVYAKTVFEDENFRILNTVAAYDENKFPYPSNDKRVEVMVKGLFPQPDYPQQTLEVTGEWRYDQRHKQYTIAVEYAIPLLPTTETGVYRFTKAIPGLGEVTAKRIAQKFKHGFVLPNGSCPDADWLMAAVKGLRESKANALYQQLRRINTTGELTRLLKNCVSGQTIRNIANRYGTTALDIVNTNPYRLFVDRVVQFSSADEIAMATGIAVDDSRRIRAGILSQIRARKERRAAIIAEKDFVIGNSIQLLHLPEEIIVNEFNAMMQERVLVSAGKYCYTKDDFDTERNLALKVTEYVRAAKNIPTSDAKLFADKFEEWKNENPNIQLAERQQIAVQVVANNYLSVLTGGPGTGKTTVLKAIIETYRRANPDKNITLMAPTGLAAKRMAEACGMPARTIHKTLNLIPTPCEAGFDDSDGLSIDGGLVIVDEFSMVGIHLANFLFKAILLKPDTRLVLVGDVDQLPPVSPGAVLDGLISCGQITVTRLNRNFRQEAGSAIVDAACAINDGNTNLKFGGNFRMRVIENAENIDEETQNILETVKKAFKWSCDTFGEAQTYVLTPKRKAKPKKDGQDCIETLLSANHLNPLLRDIVNPPAADKNYFKTGARTFREGDRVINLKNTVEVLNGEIGYIDKIDKTDVVMVTVNYDGVLVEYSPDRLKELDLAYAVTVHKVQGCEYASVIYPTSSTHGSMMQRNLLYTAVTRAKKSVVIIGSKSSLEKTIQTVKSKVKQDLLSARIQVYCHKNATP